MLTLIWDPFQPVLSQWHIKDPSHSAESISGRLRLSTHTPLTQQSRSGLTMLSMHSVGTYRGIYGMKYSRKSHKDRTRCKTRIKWSGQARLVCVRHKPLRPHHVKASSWGPKTEMIARVMKKKSY